MPTSEKILGFTNIWYSEGFEKSIEYEVGGKCVVKIFKSEYFLATKIEAFKNRGNNDGRSSTDFEDIVYFLNNRTTVWEDIEKSESKVKEYIINNFNTFLKNKYIEEWISSHIEYKEWDRVNYIIESMKKVCS